jgi:hypothetical protein
VIRKRHSGPQVQADAGRDPFTGRKRWSAARVQGRPRRPSGRPRRSRPGCWSRSTRGEQRGSRTRTVAALAERWFTWHQQVRPISPVTVANDRGAIDRYLLPALGRAKLREVDAAALDALYAQVRAHGGRCRACWTRIRRGEPPLRAGSATGPLSRRAKARPAWWPPRLQRTSRLGLRWPGAVGRWHRAHLRRVPHVDGESDGRPGG